MIVEWASHLYYIRCQYQIIWGSLDVTCGASLNHLMDTESDFAPWGPLCFYSVLAYGCYWPAILRDRIRQGPHADSGRDLPDAQAEISWCIRFLLAKYSAIFIVAHCGRAVRRSELLKFWCFQKRFDTLCLHVCMCSLRVSWRVPSQSQIREILR